MPRVPTPDAFGVPVAPGGNATFTLDTSNPGAAVAARSAEATGQGLGQLGAAVSAIATDAAERADNVRVMDAASRALAERLRLTYDPKDGYVHRKGEAALPTADSTLDDAYLKTFQGKMDDIARGLGNERQREKFRAQVLQERGHLMQGLTSHIAQESRTFAVSTAEGAIKNAQDLLEKGYAEPGAVVEARKIINTAAVSKAQLLGKSGAEQAVYVREELSAAHSVAIQSMVRDGKIAAAREYLKLAEKTDEITGKAKGVLLDHIGNVGAAVEGEAGASAEWQATMKDKTRNDAVPVFDMEERLRTKFKDDPKAMQAAVASLHSRVTQFNAQQKEATAQDISAVNTLRLRGATPSQIIATPAWTRLSGTEQAKLVDHWEAADARNAARLHSEAGRALAVTQRQIATIERDDKLKFLNNSTEYFKATMADTLSNTSQAELATFEVRFGREAAAKAITKWESLQSKENRAQAKIDDKTFQVVANRFLNLDVSKFDKLKIEDKARVTQLRAAVDEFLTQEAKTNGGKPLTPADRETAIEQFVARELTNTIKVNPGLFGFTQDRPVVTITSTEASGARDIPMSAGDTLRVKQYLARQLLLTGDTGLYGPTPENLRRAYVELLRKKAR
jgi:hypothetical protein